MGIWWLLTPTYGVFLNQRSKILEQYFKIRKFLERLRFGSRSAKLINRNYVSTKKRHSKAGRKERLVYIIY